MDSEQQTMLLRLARESIRAHLNGKPLPPLPDISAPATDFGGVFVTLKNGNRLRGCIGQFNPDTDLPTTVQKMALSALRDPRFQAMPVTDDELPQLTIEISVLSRMERTNDPISLEPGIHGILVRDGMRSGCFLPQVASEQGWDAEQFLAQCCIGKAGMSPDAWKDPRTEVYLFTAEVFGEAS